MLTNGHHDLELVLLTYFTSYGSFSWPPPGGKGDGVIGHISKRDNGNWIKRLRYCVIDQSGVHSDWVNLV